MTDDEFQASRRQVLGSISAAALIAWATGSSVGQVHRNSGWVGDFANIGGPRDARPSAKGRKRWIYWARDSREIFITDWESDEWTRFGEFGSDGGTDTRINISEDGALLVADAVDLDFGDGLVASDDGDDTVTVDLDETTISHDSLHDISASDHHARYTDEETQDAVGAILSAQFTYADATPEINLDPHANDVDAHHEKTTSFAELTDTASLAQLAAILDGSDDVEAEHLGNALQLPSAGGSAPALDTWRTPNADRPTQVTLSVELNPGSLSDAELALDLDKSGGTTPDKSYHNRVPSSLSAAQIRPMPTIMVPAGGSYRVRTVSAGDGVAIDEHDEQTL